MRWFTFCTCADNAVRLVLAERLPDCVPATARRNPNVVARSELEKLIGLPAAALKLRVACLAWDMAPAATAAKLGMPLRTYQRAVTGAKSGQEPQVSISGRSAKNGTAGKREPAPKVAENRRSEAPEANTGNGLTMPAILVPPEAGIHPPAKRACAKHDNEWTHGGGHPHCPACQALATGTGEGQELAAVALAEAAAGNVAELLQARARRQAAAARRAHGDQEAVQWQATGTGSY